MSNLPEERNYIQVEETRPKASTSTSVFSRVGSAINFINTRMHQEKLWTANGPYNAFPGYQSGIDSGIVLPIDMEIWAISMQNSVQGTAGYTEFDIKKHTASGQFGTSIFSQKPSLSFASGQFSYLLYRFDLGLAVQNPAGCIQPVLLTPNLNMGDLLTCDITNKQPSGESAGITLHLRPR